jgi:iron complex transport system ATP-binding protein
MLNAHRVSIDRGGKRIVSDVSAAFLPGSVTALLGPNGAGKSTLVKALSGEWKLADGDVTYGGTSLRALTPAALSVRRAVVSQSMTLSFDFSVIEVVMLGLTVPGFGLATDERPALSALARVGLEAFVGRRYLLLSGGEKQRVQIARALCQLSGRAAAPPGETVLLLDEPTSSLDPAHQAVVMDVMRVEAERGRTVIAVLHDLNIAAAWADDVVLMQEGKVLQQGPSRAVLTDALLSKAYGCAMRVNTPPVPDAVFVLPHHLRRDSGVRDAAGLSTRVDVNTSPSTSNPHSPVRSCA